MVANYHVKCYRIDDSGHANECIFPALWINDVDRIERVVCYESVQNTRAFAEAHITNGVEYPVFVMNEDGKTIESIYPKVEGA